MIEAAMYVALGFCTAGLICLAILPAFYRRAARLTEEALRAVNPSSYAEVRAAQDQARAQHAVDLRRVEQSLNAEREKAAKWHVDATRLKTEMAALEKSHEGEIANLKEELSAKASDEKSADMLSSEVAQLKQKLAEAEKALAESWSKKQETGEDVPAKGTQGEDTSDWLPATDTMALATITGLEAEVATLKARLARVEPSVAGELDAERTETARARLAELEAQLVDTEANFITAQAEVTRLSLQLDAADIKDSDLQKHLTEQLEALATENAQRLSQLKDKDRTVNRLTGEIKKLRQDLSATSALAQVRQDFRQLVAQVSADPADKKKAVAKPSPKTAGNSAPVSNTAGDMKPKRRTRRTSASAEKPNTAPPPTPKAAESSSTTDIANAAEALVSRIVASTRKNKEPSSDNDQVPPEKTDPPTVKKPKQRRTAGAV
ncbi:hypothetical protein [Roseibium alexandrii]|uniref:hypothetical protein n=1 Tax=Roseibium alexandrii TaxID=388408 RepID=UPI0037538CD0